MVPFSERLFMNRKIKAYQAIIYIVLFYLAAVLFFAGTGKTAGKKTGFWRVQKIQVGTVEVREDQQVQQVLIAGGRLFTLSGAVCDISKISRGVLSSARLR